MNRKYCTIITAFFLLLACAHKKSIIQLQLGHLKNIPKIDTTADFTIYNTGGSDLIIEDYRSTCECTVLDLEKNAIIKPQDSLRVHLNLKRDNTVSKKQIVYITIKNNSDSIFKSFPFFLK